MPRLAGFSGKLRHLQKPHDHLGWIKRETVTNMGPFQGKHRENEKKRTTSTKQVPSNVLELEGRPKYQSKHLEQKG